MTPFPLSTTVDWHATNQDKLMDAIARIRRALQRQIGEGEAAHWDAEPSPPIARSANPSALEHLCHLFGLLPFERDLLLLCAAMEFDGTWAALCALAQGDAQCRYPTLGLALAVLPTPNWGSLAPNATLRRWRLIDVGAGNALTHSPLRIDERILHYLAGVQHLDDRLVGLVEPIAPDDAQPPYLVPSHQELADRIKTTWMQSSRAGITTQHLPLVQLCGEDSLSKQAIATVACHQLGLNLHIVAAEALPLDTSQIHLVKILCEREYALANLVVLINCDRSDTIDNSRESAITRLLEGIHCPVMITRRDRRPYQRPQITIDVVPPTSSEQRSLWRSTLGEQAEHLTDQLETLISHFSLNTSAIQTACVEFRSRGGGTHRNPQTHTNGKEPSTQTSGNASLAMLWDICRSQARPRLDELAQRIDAKATWDDLILPDKERQVLSEIAAHVHQRMKVYEQWGFGARSSRGLGISALFAGASGTGKTLSAEVLAQDLQLDVYRIDLSSVVSKYIGETEKNLRRVFDAAEGSGVILLFDEADALFGKRSEVKDSHDRYANMEVSYLLQRMEAYRGLAILTTNLKGSIDHAFLRRMRFIVQFPFPDAAQRAEIWRQVFPKQTPTAGLDFDKLARLNVSGGNIRNIAMNAAFLAANADEPIGMKHILQSAKSEYVKLERPLTDAEVKGWI